MPTSRFVKFLLPVAVLASACGSSSSTPAGGGGNNAGTTSQDGFDIDAELANDSGSRPAPREDAGTPTHDAGNGGGMDAGNGGGMDAGNNGGTDAGNNGGTDAGSGGGTDAATPMGSRLAIWTNRYDNQRTGQNLQETVLNASNVNPTRFGLLFSRTVVGQIYAQPLYLSGVDVPGRGPRNVVYVATAHNEVYAFDAEDPAASAPYWRVNLGPSVPFTNYDNCPDMQPEIGITSTPVIDTRTGILYVEAKTLEGTNYVHRLHALDVATGRPRMPAVVITAQIPGHVNGAPEMRVFDSRYQMNRPGLLLVNGTIYIAFASHCDREVYHGWVLGYDATTMRQVAVYNSSRHGMQAGIWMSGCGPSADESGDVYVTTGNGTVNHRMATPDLGNSVLRLRRGAGTSLEVADYFTAYNHEALDLEDRDLGNTGVLLIPGTNLAIAGSKQGMVYVLDRGRMGRFNAGGDTQIVQRFLATNDPVIGHIHGTPVYWNGPSGPGIFLWGEEDVLRHYRLVGGRFETTPDTTSTVRAPDRANGGFLAISANGNAPGSAVLWANAPLDGLREGSPFLPSVLRAFDPTDLRRELWNSEMNGARDRVGLHAKFNTPVIANGRVYLGTFSNALRVYGLLR